MDIYLLDRARAQLLVQLRRKQSELSTDIFSPKYREYIRGY